MLRKQFPDIYDKLKKKFNMSKTFDFWNHRWECAMEGGRIIHEKYPYVFYDERRVKHHNGEVTLSMGDACIYAPIHHWDGKDYMPQYGGGLIRSIDTFTYGTFSAWIKMPQGSGLWPAFWLCGDGHWPEAGEIDIVEGYSDNEYIRWATPYFPWIIPHWNVTTNIHCLENNKHKEVGSRGVSILKHPQCPTQYHKYAPRQHRDVAYFDIKPDFTLMHQPYKNPEDKRIAKRIAEGHEGGMLYDWWEINQVKNVSKKGAIVHPCQMPVDVMRRVVGVIDPEYVIVDPFMGSGTTAIACIMEKRHFIGFEISKDYFNLANRNIDRHQRQLTLF